MKKRYIFLCCLNVIQIRKIQRRAIPVAMKKYPFENSLRVINLRNLTENPIKQSELRFPHGNIRYFERGLDRKSVAKVLERHSN